jgi:DNA-directed RNA polymerase specialized sigma24 family protein
MDGADQARPEAVQDERYARAAADFGPALERLSRAYEADADQRQDLLQEIHLAIWRSFARLDGRCSERTWIYRVAPNVATSHVLKRRRLRTQNLLTLAELAAQSEPAQAGHIIIALVGVIAVLVFAAIWLLNQRGADRLQRQIKEL